MARQNMAFLRGRVVKNPTISINKETGEYNYAMCYLDVVRGFRQVDDDVKFVKHDHPLIMTRDKEIIDSMRNWKENSIIFVKGPLTTRKMEKTSFCPNCQDENGNQTKNIATGNLVYVTPVFVEKLADYDDKQAAVEDIVAHREISNQIYVMGTLLSDPKLITTKKGVQFSQYRLAINRKYIIRTDDPAVRTDWPIVKSYGEQAREDKLYLKYQADVEIDGFLQARNVLRKCKCKKCENLYEWKDHTMELVPYDVEYISGFKTKDEVEGEAQKSVEDLKQMLFKTAYSDEITDADSDLKSDDVNPATIG